MNWLSIILIGLIGTVLIVIVKQYKPEIAVVLGVVVGIVMLLAAVRLISPVFDEISDMINESGASRKNITILIKALGICYITQFVSDICKDAGQLSVSTKVELVGRIAMCITALPLYIELIDLIKTIIEGI